MSRRTRRPARSTPVVLAPAVPCPCGLPGTYGACCGRFHCAAALPATAEELMRSRYSAFVALDTAYLLRTWSVATRPGDLDLDPATRWTGLEIHAATDGSAFHTSGTVTFTARYTHQGTPGTLRERSTFAREQGRWVYVDGTFTD